MCQCPWLFCFLCQFSWLSDFLHLSVAVTFLLSECVTSECVDFLPICMCLFPWISCFLCHYPWLSYFLHVSAPVFFLSSYLPVSISVDVWIAPCMACVTNSLQSNSHPVKHTTTWASCHCKYKSLPHPPLPVNMCHLLLPFPVHIGGPPSRSLPNRYRCQSIFSLVPRVPRSDSLSSQRWR